ncbi:hypothetical protein BDV95DRAFT_601739 [Massariosphaeria phaeospora]|uniref:Protein kinase domain-containing protein n=1 Tax=Massariosphaeria phaeospora TaxID=100035 RepID=A0A7C8IHI6_9PLEO|nr:hypothetical protein BDV95DRAFT_601739 [Massariosphaeria phaeospora]
MALRVIETRRLQDGTIRYILQDSQERFWHGVTRLTTKQIKTIDPATLQKTPIDARELYIPYIPSRMTRWRGDPEAPPAHVFIKKIRLMLHDEFLRDELQNSKDCASREIRCGELLKRHPHPNICAYRGVVTNASDLVVGIAYQRYECSIDVLIQNVASFNAPLVVSSIEKAVYHMHRYGLVHCDVHPRNIFFTRGKEGRPDQVVLGDFDAAHVVRERLCDKCGSEDYFPSTYTWHTPVATDIDLYSVRMLRKKLCVGGQSSDPWDKSVLISPY